MRDYKGWTAEERLASFAKTKAAIAAGIIPPPTQCNRCGKTTGRIDYHNHDYSDPIKYLEQVCQGCHTRLHRMENKEIDNQNNKEPGTAAIKKAVPKIPVTKVTNETIHTVTEKAPVGVSADLNSWLEKGMTLPLGDLSDHIQVTPVGEKPLHALRGLGIVFSGGFSKLYNCAGYPQTVGQSRDRLKFDVVVERVIFHEKNGQSLKVKGMSLSEKLKSNFVHNR
ncbi:MAG: hypothetical protein JZU65_20685 [Chlorobium sp.]|nr:hypothetical protein [Chlorobium sp.]